MRNRSDCSGSCINAKMFFSGKLIRLCIFPCSEMSGRGHERLTKLSRGFKLKIMEAFFNDNPRPSKRLSYGTAGFRANVNLPLNSVFSRMGVLASLRSLVLQNQPIGVMITASHNAEEDNGLKIVDFDGGMLTQSWEPLAEQLVNAESGAEAMVVVTNILKPFEPIAPREPVVIIGRDTRPHSMELFECVRNGASVAGAQIIDLGEVSTPLLHFVVHYLHSTHRHEPITQALINEAREQYCSRTVGGYRDLVSLVPREAPHRIKRIIVDCSFGVGSISLQQVLDVFGSRSSDDIVVEMRNVARAGRVNEGCGAELVQKGVNPPSVGIDSNTDAGVLLCSYDGDADRIVFHGFCNNGWILLDGDKIAALLASLVHTELVKAGLSTEFTLGVVQSAYANGASTNYFRSNNIPVAMAKTGVKYMHHVALDFDIGTYFEANGHGTILFSQRFATVVNEQVAELEENRNTSSEVYQGLKNLQVSFGGLVFF